VVRGAMRLMRLGKSALLRAVAKLTCCWCAVAVEVQPAATGTGGVTALTSLNLCQMPRLKVSNATWHRLSSRTVASEFDVWDVWHVEFERSGFCCF